MNQSPLTRLTPGQSYDSAQYRTWRTPDCSSIYVGGLPLSVTQAQLFTLFQAHGRVNGVEIISKPVNNGKHVAHQVSEPGPLTRHSSSRWHLCLCVR